MQNQPERRPPLSSTPAVVPPLATGRTASKKADAVLCDICLNPTGLSPDDLDQADPVCSEACHQIWHQQNRLR